MPDPVVQNALFGVKCALPGPFRDPGEADSRTPTSRCQTTNFSCTPAG